MYSTGIIDSIIGSNRNKEDFTIFFLFSFFSSGAMSHVQPVRL